jgi:hypothetical protein
MFSSVALISRSAWSFVLFPLVAGEKGAAKLPISTPAREVEEKDSDPNKSMSGYVQWETAQAATGT